MVDGDGDGDGVRGILTQEALLRGLSEHGARSSVSTVMVSAPRPLDAHQPVASSLDQRDAKSRLLPVVDRGRLVGILTADNVFELLRFRAALGARRA